MRVRPALLEGERNLPDPMWLPRRDMLLTSSPGFRQERVSSLLTPKTDVKSPAEEACKWALLERGVVAYYEVHTFPVSDGVHAYLPDFTLELTVNGKQVILEPHGFPSEVHMTKSAKRVVRKRKRAYLGKMGTFHEDYRSDLHLIIISNYNGKGLREVADEYWNIPIINARPIESYRAGEIRLGQKLSGLIRRSDQRDLFISREREALKELARAS